MKTIYKYQLEHTTEQKIQMPKDSEILCVQVQNDIPCIWAKVDTSKEMEDRSILTIGTGHPLQENNIKYIGTYQVYGGSYVFHVFEIL